MTVKVTQKIIGYEVVQPTLTSTAPLTTPTVPPTTHSIAPPTTPSTVHTATPIHNSTDTLLQRPDELEGSTYKIKTPQSEHALYVTINDVVLHRGTKQEKRRPFEIFINSKNMENFAWIVALTRVISAVFRQSENPSFLVDELKSVFDPKGGYFKPGGKYMPSLVAEIGTCIEKHINKHNIEQAEETKTLSASVKNTMQCPKCGCLSYVVVDGCGVCIECSYSKCG